MKALVKITAAMAALTMAAAVIPAGITASAASETKSVSYLRLINGSVTFPERLVVYGGRTVNLVLGDNSTFNCPKGIYVSPDAGCAGMLNIYSRAWAAIWAP